MKAKLALLLIAAVVLSQNLFADSPLTSTPISEAYKDSKIVLHFTLRNYCQRRRDN